MPYADGLLLEVTVIGGINVHEFLRIAIHQWEPGALYLDHQPVSFFEGMGYIRDGEFYRFDLTGFERGWFFEALTESAAHDLAVDEHLVAAHRVGLGQVVSSYGSGRLGFVAEVIGEDIDHLDDEVGIRAAEADLEVGDDRSCQGKVFR